MKFQFVSPKIYPLFPADRGEMIFTTSVADILRSRSEVRDYTGAVRVTLSVCANGAVHDMREFTLAVKDGVVQAEKPLVNRLSAPTLGYVEVSVQADEPIFHRVNREPGYALFCGADGRLLTVNADSKYANHFVIEQMKSWRKFCLVHTAVYWNAARGVGNSLMLINPYQREIAVKVATPNGKVVRRRVPSASAETVDLSDLVDERGPGTVMLTANNRIVVYDVRHRAGEFLGFNSIDHMDVFSGIATARLDSALGLARLTGRRLMRRFGGRYT